MTAFFWLYCAINQSLPLVFFLMMVMMMGKKRMKDGNPAFKLCQTPDANRQDALHVRLTRGTLEGQS